MQYNIFSPGNKEQADEAAGIMARKLKRVLEKYHDDPDVAQVMAALMVASEHWYMKNHLSKLLHPFFFFLGIAFYYFLIEGGHLGG